MRKILKHRIWIISILTVICMSTGCGAAEGIGLSINMISLPQVPIRRIEETADGNSQTAEETEESGDICAKVTFLDVGQAECILIQTKSENILVDAGLEQGMEREPLISNYLSDLKVDKIDYLILTHPHPDHIGEAAYIISDYDVGTIYMSGVYDEIAELDKLLAAIEEKGMTYTVPQRGDGFLIDTGYEGDRIEFITDSSVDWGDNLNNWSIGFKLYIGPCTFIMCGDIDKDAEAALVRSGVDLRADVLKVTHHGSVTSTTESFLDAIHPSVAVISCGIDNIFGSPDRRVLDRLKKRNITCYRTDCNGTISAVITDEGIRWEVEKSE